MIALLGIFTGPFGKVATYAAAIAAALLALLAAYAGVKRIGAQQQQVADLQKTVSTVKVATDVQNSVAAASDDAVDRELRAKFSRPD